MLRYGSMTELRSLPIFFSKKLNMQIKLVAKIQTLSTFNTKLKQLMISSMAQPCRIREMIQKGVELNQDQVK